MQMRAWRNWLVVSSLFATLALGCATKPNDAQLATNLKAQMFSDPQTKSANLQVNVKSGVVTLSGTAPSDAARYEAYKLATTLPGVTKVNDQMTIQTPVQTTEATPSPATVTPAPEPSPRHETKLERARERKRLLREKKKHPHHVTPVPTESAVVETSKPVPSPQSAPTSAPATPAQQPTTPTATPAVAVTQAPPPAPPPPDTAVFATGTTIEVQTIDSIDSKNSQAGDEFQATLVQPLTWNSRIIVPKGANVYLRLVEAQTSGQYKGRSELQLTLVRLEFQGAQYHLSSTTYTEVGNSRGKDTAEKVGGGAVLGAIIGAIAGGGKGAVIGGAAGAGAGGVYQGASKAKQVRIPSETQLDFKLDQPLRIQLPPSS